MRLGGLDERQTSTLRRLRTQVSLPTIFASLVKSLRPSQCTVVPKMSKPVIDDHDSQEAKFVGIPWLGFSDHYSAIKMQILH